MEIYGAVTYVRKADGNYVIFFAVFSASRENMIAYAACGVHIDLILLNTRTKASRSVLWYFISVLVWVLIAFRFSPSLSLFSRSFPFNRRR